MTLSKWKTLSRSLLERTRIFSLFEVKRVNPDARENPGTFWVMEVPDWVNILALTDDGQLVMVRQYRHGNDDVTLEIPGGNVDPNESSLEAAIRELKEETGYGAHAWIDLGDVQPNPALMTNRCKTYLALGAHRVSEPTLDAHEDIEILLIDRPDFDTQIASGVIQHAMVVCAAYLLGLWEDQQKV